MTTSNAVLAGHHCCGPKRWTRRLYMARRRRAGSTEFRVQNSGYRVQGTGYREQGAGSGERGAGYGESLRMIEKMFSLIERELEWNT